MNTATQIVHWPGKDIAACDEHAEKIRRLGHHMGFVVFSTTCEPTVCTNCENEAKKVSK